MAAATRAMYLASGILMLVSGIYINSGAVSILSGGLRLGVGLATAIYFLVQLIRFLIAECPNPDKVAPERETHNLGLDFVRR